MGVESSETPAYVIDGYNVIRRDKQLRSTEDEHGLEEGRKTLLNQIAESQRLAKTRVIVVFDGTAGAAHSTPSRSSGLDVRFSLHPQNADQKIVSILKSRRDNSSLTVVTADIDLQWEVKKLGAHVVDPGEFIAQFFARKRPRPESTDEPMTSPEDLAWGLKTFGDGIIKIEAAGKTPSRESPKSHIANVEDKKERNKKRYLRQLARKR